jgi:hypothetical protein
MGVWGKLSKFGNFLYNCPLYFNSCARKFTDTRYSTQVQFFKDPYTTRNGRYCGADGETAAVFAEVDL